MRIDVVSFWWAFRVSPALIVAAFALLLVVGSVSGPIHSSDRNSAPLLAQFNPFPEPFQIASFSVSPTQTPAGNEVQGSVSLSGGTAPL
jgi:hypothetical protein